MSSHSPSREGKPSSSMHSGVGERPPMDTSTLAASSSRMKPLSSPSPVSKVVRPRLPMQLRSSLISALLTVTSRIGNSRVEARGRGIGQHGDGLFDRPAGPALTRERGLEGYRPPRDGARAAGELETAVFSANGAAGLDRDLAILVGAVELPNPVESLAVDVGWPRCC